MRLYLVDPAGDYPVGGREEDSPIIGFFSRRHAEQECNNFNSDGVIRYNVREVNVESYAEALALAEQAELRATQARFVAFLAGAKTLFDIYSRLRFFGWPHYEQHVGPEGAVSSFFRVEYELAHINGLGCQELMGLIDTRSSQNQREQRLLTPVTDFLDEFARRNVVAMGRMFGRDSEITIHRNGSITIEEAIYEEF